MPGIAGIGDAHILKPAWSGWPEISLTGMTSDSTLFPVRIPNAKGGIMRRALLALVMLTTGCILFAQAKAIKAGDFMISGGISGVVSIGSEVFLDADGDEIIGSEESILNIGFDCEVGYFPIKGLEGGPAFRITLNRSSDPEDDETYNSSTTISIGLQLGYFHDLGGMLAVYAKASGLYNRLSGETVVAGITVLEYTQNGFLIKPEAGVALFVDSNAAIQIGGFFGYTLMTDVETEISSQDTQFGVAVSASIFL
jgi:hypothetical protein